MDQQIHMFLGKLRRRLGLQKALDIFPLFLSFGFFVAFLHVLFGYFHPFYYAGSAGFLWILFSFTVGFVYFCLHVPKEMDAAHTGDRVIGHERLLTALELRGNNSAISCLQKEDTLAHLPKCHLRKAFPYHFPVRRIAVCFLAFLLFLVFLILPSDAKSRASRLHEIQQKAKMERALLEDLQKELREEKELEEKKPEAEEDAATSPETIGGKLNAHNKFDTVNDLLEKAKAEYASADSEKDLERAKMSLYSKLLDLETKGSSNSYEEREAFSSLIKKMGYTPKYQTSSEQAPENSSASGENTDSNDSENTSGMDTETASSNESTAKNTGNAENAGSDHTAASNTSSGGGNSEGQNNDDNGAKPSGNQQNGNGNSSEKGGNSEKSHQSQNHEAPAENKKQTNSSNNENGTENGNGSGNGNGTGNSSGNGTGNGNGTGKNYGSQKGIERKSNTSQTPEQITIMEETIGDDENLTGTVSESGNSQTRSSDDPLSSGTKKNFDDVVSDYANSAYAAIQNNKIPSSMTYVVENYFSDLNS